MLGRDLTTDKLEDMLADMGLTVDPDLEIQGGMSKDVVIDQYKNLLTTLKLLILSGELDDKKLDQALDLSRGFK